MDELSFLGMAFSAVIFVLAIMLARKLASRTAYH